MLSHLQLRIDQITKTRDRGELILLAKQLAPEDTGFAAFACIEFGWTDGLRALLEIGVDPNLAWGRVNNAPLHAAAIHLNADAVALLLQRGADSNCVNDDGWSPLHMVVDSLGESESEGEIRQGESVLTSLILAGADPNASDLDGVTPQALADEYNLPFVKALFLEHEAGHRTEQ